MRTRLLTDEVVYHHALYRGDVSAATIREWHIKRGWSDIGYHYIVHPNGTWEMGRELKLRGAHALGNNAKTVGVLFIGDFRYDYPTIAQLQTGLDIHRMLENKYGQVLKHSYHRNYENLCPGPKFPRKYYSAILNDRS